MANPIIREIILKAIFDLSLLAETVVYNGETIPAIVEIGVSEVVKSPAMYHVVNTTQIYDEGLLTVCLTDVPSPQRGDKVIYMDKTYYVDSEYLKDTNGGNITLRIKGNEKGYRNK